MGTNHLAMRPSARLLITLLATLSILAAQFAVFAGDPAQASDREFEGFFTFEDQDSVNPLKQTIFYGPVDGGGPGAVNDISLDNYHWANRDDGTFHISCSETLVNTQATVTGDAAPWPEGTVLTITGAAVDRTGTGSGGDCTWGDQTIYLPAPAPIFTDPSCESPDGAAVGFTNATEYTYSIDDAANVAPGGTVVVTAAANAGYALVGQASWEYTFASVADCDDERVTAIDPIVTQSAECGVEGTYTIPDTTGVQYLLDGDPIDPGTYNGPITDTITAAAEDNYELTNPDFTYDLVVHPADDCAPRLSITKTAEQDGVRGDPLEVNLGDSFSYVLTVSNDSEATAASRYTSVVDDVPAPFTVEGVDGCEVQLIAQALETSDSTLDDCLVPPLEPGEDHQITIVVSVPGEQDAYCGHPITNVAGLYDVRMLDDIVLAESNRLLIDSDSADVQIVGCDPDIALTKSAVAIDSDELIVGELVDLNGEKLYLLNGENLNEPHTITYVFDITNSGNVSLYDVALDDPMLGGDVTIEDTTLAPGASTTGTATYDLTDEDIATGNVPNTATVTGEDEAGTEVTDTDDETISIVQVEGEVLQPGISVVKDAVDGVTEDDEGNLLVAIEGEDGDATVTYQYVVTNTGDDTLTDLTLVDDKIGDLTDELVAAVTSTYGEAILPVDGSVTVTADHVVTADDFDGLSLTNVVDVVGVGVDSSATVTDDDDETVVLVEVLDTTETATTQELPKTGLNTTGLAGLGLLLAMIGAASLLFTRRRHAADAS